METLEITTEQRQALQALPGEPIAATDRESGKTYFIVEEDLLRRALDAMRAADDLAAIRRGIAEMEAGLGEPFAEVDARIRNEFGFPPRS